MLTKTEIREPRYYWEKDNVKIGLFYEDGSWRHYEQEYLCVTWYGPSELTSRDRVELGLETNLDEG